MTQAFFNSHVVRPEDIFKELEIIIEDEENFDDEYFFDDEFDSYFDPDYQISVSDLIAQSPAYSTNDSVAGIYITDSSDSGELWNYSIDGDEWLKIEQRSVYSAIYLDKDSKIAYISDTFRDSDFLAYYVVENEDLLNERPFFSYSYNQTLDLNAEYYDSEYYSAYNYDDDYRFKSNIYFVDIDNDGDVDGMQIDNQRLRSYENDGGVFKEPVYEPEYMFTGSLKEDIDLNGEITLADIDSDGDQDIFVINANTSTNYLILNKSIENTGDNKSPVFSLSDIEKNPFNLPTLSNINGERGFQFIDLDYDGDLDAYFTTFSDVNPSACGLDIYENIGNANTPEFKTYANRLPKASCPDVGTFIDIDQDGDLDLFGSRTKLGFLYYENEGNNTEDILSANDFYQREMLGSYGMIYDYVGEGTNPNPRLQFIDFDGDGDDDLFYSIDGKVNYFENNLSKNSGHTANVVELFGYNLLISESDPQFKDIDLNALSGFSFSSLEDDPTDTKNMDLIQTSVELNGETEVIELLNLKDEIDANVFITLDIEKGEVYDSTISNTDINKVYNIPAFEPGTHLLDFNNNGLVDAIVHYLVDGGFGDVDAREGYVKTLGFLGTITENDPSTVKRLYNSNLNAHLLSSNKAEIDILTSGDWISEGTYSTVTNKPTAEVYRFYNTSTNAHFYTALEAEKDMIIGNIDDSLGWQYEGIAFSAYSLNDHPNDVTAVIRYFNSDNGCHLYSTNIYEQGKLDQDSNWLNEGIAWYVDPIVSATDLI